MIALMDQMKIIVKMVRVKDQKLYALKMSINVHIHIIAYLQIMFVIKRMIVVMNQMKLDAIVMTQYQLIQLYQYLVKEMVVYYVNIIAQIYLKVEDLCVHVIKDMV